MMKTPDIEATSKRNILSEAIAETLYMNFKVVNACLDDLHLLM